MKCGICSEEIKKTKSEFGRYKHYFYLLNDRFYRLRYGDYSRSIHAHLAISKDDVMACGKCCISSITHIIIPEHIPEKQYKDYLKLFLEVKLTNDTNN